MSKKIKVATFNIWKNDGDFPNRIFKLNDELKENKLDIICLQEDYESKEFSSSKYLNKNLDFNYISTKTRKKIRDNKLSSSNLTILSKYKIKLVDEIFFDKETEDERACQIIEVELKDKKLLLVNTHLSHISSEQRENQIKKILKFIKNYSAFYDVVMFCGDLNALPNSKEILQIKEKGFVDKNIQFSHKDGVIIDYIFYKSKEKIKVTSKIVLKDYSDHYCLVSTFRF
ncbi:endonuclease/exonuclease/phosphatase family protein [Arcobacter sp. YIC-464]|uniref:endonuclease/exonuclease/phosphatase family protein n=1 Tax=Arcobacter sp. YIC-464 TaxID=3376631 RepID=UPI003C15CD7E